MTLLTSILDDNPRLYPEYTILQFEGREYTNLQLHRKFCQLGNGLLELGLHPGDTVLVHMENCPEITMLYGACIKAGIIFCPTLFLISEEELSWIAEHSEAKYLVTTPNLLPKARAACPRLGRAASPRVRRPARDVLRRSRRERADRNRLVERGPRGGAVTAPTEAPTASETESVAPGRSDHVGSDDLKRLSLSFKCIPITSSTASKSVAIRPDVPYSSGKSTEVAGFILLSIGSA